MEEANRIATKRICDIIAVVTEDIDAVTVAVDDGVAYIGGVVPTAAERDAIISAVRQIGSLNRVVTSLATEHILPRSSRYSGQANVPSPVLMHYYSLS